VSAAPPANSQFLQIDNTVRLGLFPTWRRHIPLQKSPRLRTPASGGGPHWRDKASGRICRGESRRAALRLELQVGDAIVPRKAPAMRWPVAIRKYRERVRRNPGRPYVGENQASWGVAVSPVSFH